MSTRREQILHNAIALIVSKGYAALTMRAVARDSGLTLGALQYHYPTRNDLLNGLTNFIAAQYTRSFSDYVKGLDEDVSLLHASLDFSLVDPVEPIFKTDRLFPQLWAMSLVEPSVKELLDNLYQEYLSFLEECLRQRGVTAPQSDALVLMGLFEGLTLFVARGQRWEAQLPSTVAAARAFIDARYNDPN